MGFPTSITCDKTMSARCFGLKMEWPLAKTCCGGLKSIARTVPGKTKSGLKDRRKWVSDNRKEIEAVAADPFTAAKLWHDKDEPFRYVAACRELAAAWRKPGTFVTHLPIPFDGSCNGLQHLSLLSRDKESGARVNLAACDKPRDIYTDIAVRVRELIERDETAGAADWRDAFKRMDTKR